MSDKYCIASGDYSDTSIWSNTPGGSGGASAPVFNATSGDNIIFAVSVTVTNIPKSTETSGKIIVQEGATVTIQPENVATTAIYFRTGGGLEVSGNLTLLSQYIYFRGSSRCFIAPGGIIDASSNVTLQFANSSQLINEGTIQSTVNNRGPVDLYTDDTAIKHRLGRCTKIRSQCIANVLNVSSYAPAMIDTFQPYCGATGTNRCRFETETTILKELSFFQAFDSQIILENMDVFNVCGDIKPVTGQFNDIVWNNLSAKPLFFTGTANQTITLPSNVTDQYWTIEKPAGLLDLVHFNGFLQGRVRQLIVRGASNIDLSGTPPFLPTSSSGSAFYLGLKADAASTGQPSDREGLLRESLDFCYNYGVMTIPAGKVLCTKILRNETGAEISGNGTICVRYGELTNTGNIDPNITVQYFDLPIAASLSAPSNIEANAEFFVDLSGSVGHLFRVDWADGSFSETTVPNQLFHVYADVETEVSKTLVLMVTTSEGTQQTTSQTILLHPKQIQPPPTTEPRLIGTVDMEERKKYFGIPRGNMPFPYRYALAQGRCFMYDTLQLFCPMNESGRALENGSGLYLGRIAYSDGQIVLPEEIASASYTIYRLDDSDASIRTAVEGHEDVPLEIGDVLLSETLTDENWNFDNVGYNFRHTPDDSTYPPFPKAGRNYLVAYTLRLLEGIPKIQIQYRVRVV